MVEVRPFCFLLLLKLAGSSGLWTRRGDGTRVPLTHKAPEKGGLLGGCGGKSPLRGGNLLEEKSPHLRWEEDGSHVGWPGATGSEQTPGRTHPAAASPPWLQGQRCPGSTEEPWQPRGSWVLKTSLVCTLGALVAVGNGVVLVVIASAVSGWSHSSRLVLLSLAAADAALALLVVPLNLYRSLALGPGVEESAGEGDALYCRAVAFLNSSIFGASLYSLAGVSLERYLAVFFPLHHWRLLSRRRVALLIAAAWLLPVLLLVPLSLPGPLAVLQVRFSAAALLCEPDYGSNTAYSVFMAGTIFCPAAGTVTFTNLRLWLAARSQHRRRNARLVLSGKEAAVLRRLHLPQLAAASRVLMPVVIAFYICWAPCIGTILYNAITHERVHEWVEFVALWLPTGSGFLNCFVYFWVNRSFRHKFQRVGHKLCCRARWQEQHRRSHPLPTLGAAVEEDCKQPGSSWVLPPPASSSGPLQALLALCGFGRWGTVDSSLQTAKAGGGDCDLGAS